MVEDPHQSNRKFYDRIAHAYDLIADAGEHKARESGEAMLNLRTGESVLEIGFGTGNSLVRFAREVGPSGHVKGVDISPKMAEVAKSKLNRELPGNQVERLIGMHATFRSQMGNLMRCFPALRLSCFPWRRFLWSSMKSGES